MVPVCITAGDGKIPGMFKRTLIRFGKPIPAQELGLTEGTSMHLRRASRIIMGEIAKLREESLKELGLPLPAPAESEKKPAQKEGDAAMSLQVEVAKTAGFCFGVDRAVSAVYRLLGRGQAGRHPGAHHPQPPGDGGFGG